QRYLADEPVVAGPPTATYRLRKFVRRNRGPVLASAVVLLALVGGIIGTSLGLVRADRALQSEAEQRKLAEDSARKALAAAAAEKEAKEDALQREDETRAAMEFVEKRIFSVVRPEGVEGGLGRDITLRKVVEFALPYVENSFPKQPYIEARLRMTLGISFLHLGDPKTACEQCEAAFALHVKSRGRYAPETLRCVQNL